ncbi:Lyrm4 [Columba livia]|nr:Lyrm4 [Columba livia]
MAASSRAQVLRLYRALLRESQRFSSYNYRTYAVRRIRDAFRENKHIKDSEKIEELVNKAKANLEVIHRQWCYRGVNQFQVQLDREEMKEIADLRTSEKKLNREDGSFVQRVPGQIDGKGLDLCSHICADYCCHLTAQELMLNINVEQLVTVNPSDWMQSHLKFLEELRPSSPDLTRRIF